MTSNKNKLFVRRNEIITKDFAPEGKGDLPFGHINVISQANEFSFSKEAQLVGMAARTTYDEIFEKYDPQAFHNQLKPLMIILRVLGCFPVHIPSSGVPRFNVLSSALAYSICLYSLVNVTTYFNVKERLAQIFKTDVAIGEAVSNSMLVVLLVNCSCIPLLAWLDTPKTVLYYRKWIQFQTMFARVTEERLVLSVQRRCIFILIASFVVGFAAYLLRPFYLLEYWQLICYYMSILILTNMLNMWSVMSRSVYVAAKALNKCFKRDLKEKTISADLIGEYRILWLRWSQLVSQIGCMMGKVFGFYLVILLLAITMSLYGFLSAMNGKKTDYYKSLDMGLVCLACTVALYCICNDAHYFSNLVGIEVRNELQLISPSEVSEDVLQEVNMFLETIVMNPPVVSVAGFASVDRGLFRAYASTIVTYMIVLVQFDQSGGQQDKCNANDTNALN